MPVFLYALNTAVAFTLFIAKTYSILYHLQVQNTAERQLSTSLWFYLPFMASKTMV